MEAKPGTKTSEFWVMLIVNIVAFIAPLITERLEASAAPWALVAASVIVGLNTGLYHYSRGLAKQKGTANENLRGELLGALYGALSGQPSAVSQNAGETPALPGSGGTAAGGNGVYHGPAGPGPAGPGNGQPG